MQAKESFHGICPLTNKVMRYPVLADSNIEESTHYEAKALLDYLNNNNNQGPNGPISYCVYDLTLKNLLDTLAITNRYEEYDYKECLKLLQLKLQVVNENSATNSFSQSLCLFRGLFSLMLFLMMLADFPSDTVPLALLFVSGVSFADFVFRVYAQENYGLLHTLKDCIDIIILEYHEMNRCLLEFDPDGSSENGLRV